MNVSIANLNSWLPTAATSARELSAIGQSAKRDKTAGSLPLDTTTSPRFHEYFAQHKVRSPEESLDTLNPPLSSHSGPVPDSLAERFNTAGVVRDERFNLARVRRGTLEVQVFTKGSAQPQRETIEISLGEGESTQTTFAELIEALNNIEGISAKVNREQLQVTGDLPETEFRFVDETNLIVEMGSENPELRETFNQFVGEFLFGQMLKSLRSTLGKPAYMHGGRAEEVFQGQLDTVMSEQLAGAHGGSFAQSLYEQEFGG